MKKEKKTSKQMTMSVLVIWELTSSSIFVVGVGNMAVLNMLDVLHKEFIMPLHFLGSFAVNSLGHVVPTVGGVLVVHSKSPLERLVLLSGPRARATGGN